MTPQTSPASTQWPGVYDLATISVTESDLSCQPPPDWAVAWVTEHLTQSAGKLGSQLPLEDFATVNVGPGQTAQSTWWIVAVVSYDDSYGPMERRDMSFLTDSQLWNNVGSNAGKSTSLVDWRAIPWTGAQLERGLEAQKLALSCLPISD